MNEDKMRQIAKEVFDEQLGKTQYNVSSIPFHIHNQTDSPQIPPTSVQRFTMLPATEGSNISGVLAPSNIGVSEPPFNIIYPTPVINGYGVGDFSQFNGGTAPRGSLVAFFNEALVFQLWILLKEQEDLHLAMTGVASIGATSATLTGNWSQDTGQYLTRFGNGESRYVTYTSGNTSMTWTGGLATSSSTVALLVTIAPVWYGVDLPNVA